MSDLLNWWSMLPGSVRRPGEACWQECAQPATWQRLAVKARGCNRPIVTFTPESAPNIMSKSTRTSVSGEPEEHTILEVL